MSDFVFRISPNILLGTQTITRLGALAMPYGTRFLLILDPATKEVGCPDKIRQSLSDTGIDFITYDEMPNNPDTTTLEQVIKLARSACIHGIIACGGEKALNLGRGVASLFNETKGIYDFVNGDMPSAQTLPLICIPTAIRDSFLFYERCATIDARSNQVCLLKMQDAITKLVIFDVSLCNTLSKSQIASISLNLLCMVFESYFSNRSTFFSDAIAEKTFELLAPSSNLTDPLAMPDSVDLSLLQCGCLSSLSVALSAPGPVTALAFAVHARYKVSRTLVSSILMPYLIEEAVFSSKKLVRAAKLLGAAGETCTTDEAATLLAENIRGRIARAGLPARLKELSLSIEQLAVAVNDAVTLDFVQYYAKPVSSDSLFNLVKQAY